MEKLQIAVVGLGYWGLKCAATLTDLFPDYELLLVDNDEQKRSRAENSYPRSRVLSRYQEIADLKPGTVLFCVVATPPSSHSEITLAFLRAGVSVLLEKPFNLSKSELKEARELSHNGVVLGAGYLYAHNPHISYIRDIISSEEYGPLIHVESLRQGFGAFRNDVSIVRDLLVHDISIALCLFEGKSLNVQDARGSFIAHTGFQSEVEATFSVEGPCSFTARCSQIRPKKIRTLTFFFRHAIVVLDEMSPSENLRLFELPPGLLDLESNLSTRRNEYPQVKEVSLYSLGENNLSPLGHSLSKFARAVLSGEKFLTGIGFAEKVADLAERVEQQIASVKVGGSP